MGAFLETLRNIGAMRLAVMGGVILGLIGFFVYLTTRLTTPQMSLLYADLQPDDSSQIVRQLETMNIPYEISGNGSNILVPSDRMLQLRVNMAEQGLPGDGSIGYEIFDNQDTLGNTSFVQNINLVRALEGELARTIRVIRSVKSARVHLVLPRRELFSRKKQDPSASIVLSMRSAQRLDKEKVLAIQHLVAAAVPGLSPTQISVVDGKGNLLARGFGSAPGKAFGQDSEDKRATFETRLARTIEELLEKTVGFGKVRAEVRAEMDFDKVTTNAEVYDPDGQVVRSTQSVEETATSRNAESEAPVGIGTNLPDGSAAGTSSNDSQLRNEETVNFEISKKITSTVRESGIVRRLSVAVLVDGVYSLGADENLIYAPRPQTEMDQLTTLVRTAIGYSEGRNDSVDVINMRFALAEHPEEIVTDLLFGLSKSDMMRMAEILVLSVVAILIILLVVRPLISRAFEAVPTALAAAEAGLLAERRTSLPALAAPGAPTIAGLEGGPPSDEESFQELIDIDRVEGRVKASSVKKVGEIVEKHPEEAIAIIRTWMYQE